MILALLMDRTPLPCPCCGSVLTSPREDPEIWECRYCYAVFPVERPLLVGETLAPYLVKATMEEGQERGVSFRRVYLLSGVLWSLYEEKRSSCQAPRGELEGVGFPSMGAGTEYEQTG
jgi:ribosomal protein L37AE/L43A